MSSRFRFRIEGVADVMAGTLFARSQTEYTAPLQSQAMYKTE